MATIIIHQLTKKSMSHPVTEIKTSHDNKLDHVSRHLAITERILKGTCLTDHPHHQGHVGAVGNRNAHTIGIATHTDSPRAVPVTCSQSSAIDGSHTSIHIYLDVPAHVVVIHGTHTNLVNDVQIAGEIVVVSVDSGTVVCHQIKELISFAVDFVAEREASGIEHLENTVLD